MLSVEHVYKFYRKDRALDDVSISIPNGECVSLIGESGSGKSTLSRIMLALDKPTKGRVCWQGEDVQHISKKKLYRDIQPVFQDSTDCFNPKRRIGESLMEPMKHLLGVPRVEREKKVLELLSMVGLSSAVAKRYPHELSVGQRKRVCIARAVSIRPKLLVLDEAVSGLDLTVMIKILILLKDLQKEFGCSCLFITHDIRAALFMSKTIAVMKVGKIVEIAENKSAGIGFKHPFSINLLNHSF